MRNSIRSGYKFVQDANLQAAASWLGCRLNQSSPELLTLLATGTHTRPEVLLYRVSIIQQLRKTTIPVDTHKELTSIFEETASLEKDLVPFFSKDSDSKEDLEADALAQLSFSGHWFQALNHIPFMLTLISAFKIWIVPTLTLATPILAWVLPYLLLKFVYALPISQGQYMEILQQMWGGMTGTPIQFGGDGRPVFPSFFSTKSIFQIGLIGFSFLQSMIQPIQNAMHLRKLDTIFTEMGTKVLRLQKIVHRLRSLFQTIGLPPLKITRSLDSLSDDPRQALHLIREQPQRLHILLKDLAQLEILWRISQKEVLHLVHFHRHQFVLQNAVDISLAEKTAVPSSVSLGLAEGGQPHAVVTGPNGGGKSSFLRAVLQSVLFAHAFGVAPASFARMPRFLWIASGLQLRDSPGKLSMFETEVRFAAEVVRMARSTKEPGLVLFDELFHSTNPPDGTRTAELFLRSLWTSRSAFSIVSTHIFKLVEEAPKEAVKAICCPAKETPGGSITYDFVVREGICRVSSVRTVWERFGLGGFPNRRTRLARQQWARQGSRTSSGEQNLPAKENQ